MTLALGGEIKGGINMAKHDFERGKRRAVEESFQQAEPVVETVEEPVVEKTTPKVVKSLMGVVVDCPRLNVRKTPDMGGTIVNRIARDTKVRIDMGESTDDWYRVRTEDDSIDGYCMKKYIKTIS